MEDDLKKKSKKNRRRPKKKMKKMKTTKKNEMENNLSKKSTKLNLIGCDTIVNSPSEELLCLLLIINGGLLGEGTIFYTFLCFQAKLSGENKSNFIYFLS